MELKNIDKAKELIPQLVALTVARRLLSSDHNDVLVTDGNDTISLPKQMRMNILHIVNCEYERIREEVKRL